MSKLRELRVAFDYSEHVVLSVTVIENCPRSFVWCFQPTVSRRLADAKSDLIPVLPLIQAMLPGANLLTFPCSLDHRSARSAVGVNS